MINIFFNHDSKKCEVIYLLRIYNCVLSTIGYKPELDLQILISDLYKKIHQIVTSSQIIIESNIDPGQEKEDILFKYEWLYDWNREHLSQLFSSYKSKAGFTDDTEELTEVVQGYIDLIDSILEEDTEIYYKLDELFETIRNIPSNLNEYFDCIKPDVIHKIKSTQPVNRQISYFQREDLLEGDLAA